MTQARFAVTPQDIAKAQERLAPYGVHTPLMTNARLDALTGARVFVKPECLQRTGSFKFRGAMNSLSSLSDDERARGVLAWSSGNHAQAVAYAAKLWSTSSTIVMPTDAPKLKMEATRAYGAEIVTYDRFTEDREAIGRQLAEKKGATIIPPYDYLPTIAGQGTAGLEIAQDLTRAEVTPDIALVCCGGGGLTAGFSIALKNVWPDLDIYAVEPEGFDDTRLSLDAGKPVPHAPESRSICDALLSPMPGDITFPINQHLLNGAVTVSDANALQAMRFAFKHLKLVTEPGGAVALAALLSGAVPAQGKTVITVISGGNVDPERFSQALSLQEEAYP